MKEVVFTSDFADKKKGELFKCDSQLASHLVHHDKVADYLNNIKEEETKKSKKVK